MCEAPSATTSAPVDDHLGRRSSQQLGAQSGVSRDRTRIRSQIVTKGVHAGFRGSGTSAGTNPGTKIPFAGQVLSIAKLRVGQEAYQLSGVAQSLDDYYTGAGETAGRWVKWC